MIIEFEDFQKIDIHAGEIITAEEFPEARKPAYKLTIDFGPDIGIKKTSAQITDHYTIKDLPGLKVMAVVNFTAKQIGPFMSEVLVLGFSNDKGHIILSHPDKTIPNGAKLH